MQKTKIQTERFGVAKERGTVTNKEGYHQPQEMSFRRSCGCKKTTSKGAYRDVSVEMPDSRLIHFYHQSPVVVEQSGLFRLDSCGWKTSTTKERINRHIPSGFFVRQIDFDWYVETPDGEGKEFKDGMIIEP